MDESDIIQNWKEYMLFSANYAENTVASYIIDARLLAKFLVEYSAKEINILNITKQALRAWILHRHNNGENARSIARGISAIKNLHSFLLNGGVITNSGIANMKSPKISKTLPRPLTVVQVNAVINSIAYVKKTDWIVKRDISLIVLIYSVGLRIGEALSLSVSDINSDFLNIIGKGGKARSVPLLDMVKKVLSEYIEIRPFATQPLFVNRFGEVLQATSVQKLVAKSRRLLGLPETTTPHSLRHTCATHIMENSGDIRGVQELLGHSLLSSTQVYADITKKHISDVYDKCHPLSSRKKAH